MTAVPVKEEGDEQGRMCDGHGVVAFVGGGVSCSECHTRHPSYGALEPSPGTKVSQRLMERGWRHEIPPPLVDTYEALGRLLVRGMPVRVQRRRTKGYRLPPNTRCVDRSTRYGNLYRVDVFGRALANELFQRSIEGYWSPQGIPDDLIDQAYEIHCETWRRARDGYYNFPRGVDAACFCAEDEACHGDTLLARANR